MKNDINDLTFIDLWNEYSKLKKIKLKVDSYRKIKNLYEKHIVPYFKDYIVKDIDINVYIDWMIKIEEKGYANSYNKSIHGALVSILNFAMKFHGLQYNIASQIGGFNNKKKVVKQKIDCWTLEEFQKFISKVDDPLYNLFFTTLFFTGLRLGECTALTWNDYDKNYFDINKTLLKEKDINGNYIINSPKTTSSIRKVRLDKHLIKKLNKLYKEEKKKENFTNNWFIFGGEKPLSQTTIGRKKDKYCEIADIKKIRLHDFRHSHATLLLSSGIPITYISKRLGHSDIAMTLNTYSHFVQNDEEIAIEKLSQFNHK